MSVYKSYLMGDEREMAIQEMAYEYSMNRLENLLVMCEMQLDDMRAQAELKVFTEGGTYDELEEILEAANNEAKEDKKNVITKIIEFLSDVLNSVINTIKNLFDSVFKNTPDDEEVEVPFLISAANSVLSNIKSFLSRVSPWVKGVGRTASSMVQTGLGIMLAVEATTLIKAGINAAKSTGREIKNKIVYTVKKKDLENFADDVRDTAEMGEDLLNTMESNAEKFAIQKSSAEAGQQNSNETNNNTKSSNGFFNDVLTGLRKAISWLRDMGNNVKAACAKFVGKKTEEKKPTKTEDEGKPTKTEDEKKPAEADEEYEYSIDDYDGFRTVDLKDELEDLKKKLNNSTSKEEKAKIHTKIDKINEILKERRSPVVESADDNNELSMEESIFGTVTESAVSEADAEIEELRKALENL